MLSTSLSTTADLQPILWALLTSDGNEVSFFVLIGLAVVAIVWIAAGLWMIHAGEVRRRVR